MMVENHNTNFAAAQGRESSQTRLVIASRPCNSDALLQFGNVTQRNISSQFPIGRYFNTRASLSARVMPVGIARKGKTTDTTFDPTLLYTGVAAIVVGAMGAGAALWVMFFGARKAKKGLNAAS